MWEELIQPDVFVLIINGLPTRVYDRSDVPPTNAAMNAALASRWPGKHVSGDWYVAEDGNAITPVWG